MHSNFDKCSADNKRSVNVVDATYSDHVSRSNQSLEVDNRFYCTLLIQLMSMVSIPGLYCALFPVHHEGKIISICVQQVLHHCKQK